eukprot:CAMPEP_0195517650 /NCGR_PEP_ID=MMETSP0794_2-20130614/11184_1 /TAXON_ID=515487 /ORGANISM="Stephanopyxis turris, Strain CCMP 815" /LENGTH=167 /DNA_ID=CAMNT_0040646487 /DNA_START=169 /DNA_END=672 /DNA_ORIENTATION=-
MDTVAMRFFRDVARTKARRRLYGDKHALVPMVFGWESPLPVKTAEDQELENSQTITQEELASYNGKDGSPLYLSIDSRVYDVSAGTKFYGEGGPYNKFVGRDATRAYATGCRSTGPECLSPSTEGLSDKQLREVDRWVELYDTHDKYTFVANLVDDPVDAVLARAEA